MPFFDIFASPRWSPLRMCTKVVSFFIFSQELSNQKNLRLNDQRWLKEPQGSCLNAYERSEVPNIRKFSACKLFWIYSIDVCSWLFLCAWDFYNSLFPAHQSQTKYFRKTFRQMFLWPHQLQKTNDKKSNLCCMKNVIVRQTLTWKQCVPTFFQDYTVREYGGHGPRKGSSIDSRCKNLETIVWKKKKKKNKEKRKKKKKMEKWICLAWTDENCSEAAFYKMEYQVLGCSNPASLFIFGCLWWILNASRNFRSRQAWALSITCIVLQSISCGSFCWWTCCATADFSVLPRRMASRCSFALTWSARRVSPTYSSSHVFAHEIFFYTFVYHWMHLHL